MMWDGFNKRKFPRLSLRCELVLRSPYASGQVISAQTENLGAGGVCVILNQALDRFAPLMLRVELDANLPWIECEGRVMWSVPAGSVASKKKNFDTGIEFVGLQPAQQDLIRHFVAARLEPQEKFH